MKQDDTVPDSRIADVAPQHTESILIIRPSVRAAYHNLHQWLGARGAVSLSAYEADASGDGVDQLRAALVPYPVHATPGRSGPPASRRGRAVLHSLGAILHRDETIVMLCADSAEAISGFTLVRVLQELPRRDSAIILSKLVRSDRIVLVGPHVTQVLPGVGGLCRPEHARKMAALAGAVGIALTTTALAAVAIGVQEALVRARVLQ